MSFAFLVLQMFRVRNIWSHRLQYENVSRAKHFGKRAWAAKTWQTKAGCVSYPGSKQGE